LIEKDLEALRIKLAVLGALAMEEEDNTENVFNIKEAGHWRFKGPCNYNQCVASACLTIGSLLNSYRLPTVMFDHGSD
jgi:hypothetical protein